jgi:S-formylglutathione hydrolase FrmB
MLRRPAALAALLAALLAVTLAAQAHGTDQHGARVVAFTIPSRLVHATMPVVAVVPPGAGAGRPLLVFLHGFGASQSSYLTDAMFAALARLGSRAPDVVFPYGDPDSYWHDRADGAWGSYVTREVIPQAVARLHADGTRVAIGGISMGGFGALDIAHRNPGRFCAVGGHSAAVFPSGGASAPGAFDDATDFARNDVLGAARAGRLAGSVPVWLDNGTQDPFRAADTQLAALLHAHGEPVQLHIWQGGHDMAYWERHWNSYLAFYADALARCPPSTNR